jgi:SAM-dependent methyltransferase
MRVGQNNQVRAISAEDFNTLYRGEQCGDLEMGAVWDTGAVQPMLVRWFSEGLIEGTVLDSGCGSGTNTVFLASQGLGVVGMDFSSAALEIARQRAAQAAVEAIWVEDDATQMTHVAKHGLFDTVVDSTLYHCLSPKNRSFYLKRLSEVCRDGAHLLMLCFADTAPEGLPGPFRISRSELESLLPSSGWGVSRISPATYQTRWSPREMQAVAEAGGTPLGEFPDRDVDGLLPLPVWEIHAQRLSHR